MKGEVYMSDLQSFLDSALKNVKLETPTAVESTGNYDIYQEIAQLLIAARTELSITQGQLAQMTGVSQANISKFETGNSRPSITTLKKIADGIGKRLVIGFADQEGEE